MNIIPPLSPGSWAVLWAYGWPWAAGFVVVMVVVVLTMIRSRRLDREAQQQHDAAVHAAVKAARRRELAKVPGGIRRAQREVDAITDSIEIVIVPRNDFR